MEDSTREADSHSVHQKIRHLLWNLEEYYRLQKSPPLNNILRRISLIHTLKCYLHNLHFI
jgi:hypothetical protein